MLRKRWELLPYVGQRLAIICTMKSIALTGFVPFGALEENPAQWIVEHLAAAPPPAGIKLLAEILPTEYEAAGARIQALLAAHRPDYLVSIGVANSRTRMYLERVGLNLDDAPMPDNAGDLRRGVPILPDGPTAYFTTLPIAYLEAELVKRDVAIQISNHAGAYVCNHVLYLGTHTAAQLGLETKTGFIHVPGIQNIPPDEQMRALEKMTAGVQACLELLRDYTPPR
jgi:pyroglutamyl-peptidase